MKQNFFKYENRSGKKIRVKDLLMLFSVLTLCVITAIVSGTAVKKKLKANTNVSKDISDNYVKEDNLNLSQNTEGTLLANVAEDNTASEDNFDFIKPVDGGILKPFSPDELVYSETMDDWRTHMGVDISCPFDTPVSSVEKGIVKDITYDINYGNTVTIQSGEYEHIYASLSSDVPVEKGQSVNKGDTIGISSDSCMSEICDDPHIHFEMKKSGIYINPMDIIRFN